MEELEKYFDTAFGATDGIKKLRELILTFAMQGKLVPQLPKENSASQLLQLINKEKSSYWKSNNTKSLGPFTEIDSENVPYNVPSGWKWVRLGEILLSITGGGTPSKNNAEYWRGSIPWASVKDLNVDTYLEKTIDSISEKAIKESSTNLIPKGSMIVCTRMGLGKIAINTIDVTINQDLKALKLSKYIDEIFFINKFKEYKIVGKGVTVHGIRQDELLNFLFPLPPIEEQKRIVARINELYRRCDELEKLRAEREQKRQAVNTASIRKMLDATDQATFDDAWQFITRHFVDLYTVRENVAELRKAILQLAVMGKLVPQDSSEGTARELMEEIKREKKKLSSKTKLKDSTSSPESNLTDIPFTLPSQWKWVQLRDIMLKITDGTHHSPPNTEKGEFLYISAKNIKDEGVQLSNASFVSKTIHNEIYSRCDPEPGNILYIKDGATTGIATINNLSQPFSMLSSVALLKQPIQINNRYLLYALRSPFFYDQMRSAMSGVAITRVTLKILNDALLPLPPLAEQNRIVAKIDQLLTLCNSVETQIDIASKKKREVLGAVMEDMF